ncbi:uncharacterized protein LOC125668926 [Ostrea edulis]|uniref:uncharacterized protein LOC125668926 n=1 Tax=Ostrea edulis TaxID=37623 RepID=UPI0024AF9EAC|nr:uncharacterized protein LOC125668926 [Ostrea edulis]
MADQILIQRVRGSWSLHWHLIFLSSTRDSHLATYKSGGAATQIDFILFRKNMCKLVTDVKVFPGEEVASAASASVCDMLIDMPSKAKHKFTPRQKVWKLKDDHATCRYFQEAFESHVSASAMVEKQIYENVDTRSSEVYCLANQIRRENVDVVGNKPVKNDTGEMSLNQEAKEKAWLEHYERLLNVEFDWEPEHLTNESPLEGPPVPITIDMVKKAISKMKSGKAAGPSGIAVEMIRAAGDTGVSIIRDLTSSIFCDGKVPTDWEQSFIVCLYKGKGDALDRGNYRGLKLTEQVMKVLERPH